MDDVVSLQIDGRTPETFPLGRLGKYMQLFADLLGSGDGVAFAGVSKGSARISALVAPERISSVQKRLASARRGNSPREPLRARRALQRLLDEDGSKGRIVSDLGGTRRVYRLGGGKSPKSRKIGPLKTEEPIQGTLTHVSRSSAGGARFRILDGKREYKCQTDDLEMARRLSKNFLCPVRVFGIGKWQRDESGQWNLKRYEASGFKKLAPGGAIQTVKELRAVKGSGWKKFDDPVAVAMSLRG